MAKARSVKLTLNLGPWLSWLRHPGDSAAWHRGGPGVVSSLTFVLSKLSQVCPSQFNSALLICWLLGRNFASYLNHWAQNWLQRERAMSGSSSALSNFLANPAASWSSLLSPLSARALCTDHRPMFRVLAPGLKPDIFILHASIFLHSEIKPNIKVMQWLQQQIFTIIYQSVLSAINPQTTYWVDATRSYRELVCYNGRKTNDQ